MCIVQYECRTLDYAMSYFAKSLTPEMTSFARSQAAMSTSSVHGNN